MAIFIGVPIGSPDQFNGSATVFMSGGTATATSPDGTAIFLDGRSGSGALSTTTNSTVINTVAGAAGFADGISVLSGSGSASLTTDAQIGSAANPFRVGLFAGVDSGNGSVTVNQTGGSIFAGFGISASSAGGSVGVTSAGTINATAGIVTVSNSGSITVNAASGITAEQNAISAQTNAGAISITNTGTLLGGGSFIDPGVGLVHTATIETVNGTGQTTITNAGTVTGRPEGLSVISAASSGGTIAIVNTADALIHSSTNSPGDLAISTSGGPATISNAGILTGRLSLGGSSNVVTNTGTWSTSGTSAIGGTFSNQAGGTFVTSGTSTIGGLSSLSNAGTFTTAGSTTFAGAFTATNSGTFSANGSTSFTGLTSFDNSGTFLANGITDFGGGNFNNTGAVNLAGGSAANNVSINNQSGGAFVATGSVNFTNVAFSNQAGGTFTTSGTTALTFNGASTFANGGAFAANGTTSISGLSSFANSGTFNANGTTSFTGLSQFPEQRHVLCQRHDRLRRRQFQQYRDRQPGGRIGHQQCHNQQSIGRDLRRDRRREFHECRVQQPGRRNVHHQRDHRLDVQWRVHLCECGAFAANGTTSISGLSSFANSGTFSANGTTSFTGLSSALNSGFLNSGTFFANGTTDFGGGNFSNSGIVNLANGSALNNVSNFQNFGTVRTPSAGTSASIGVGAPTFINASTGAINLQNGFAGDRLTIGGNYMGIPGSQLRLDFAPQSNTADLLLITGNASGSTAVAVNNLTPGVPFTTSPTLVQVNGTVAPNTFTLGTLQNFGALDVVLVPGIGNVPGSFGLSLATVPSAAGLSGAAALQGAQTLAFQSNSAVLDQVSEVRDLQRRGRPIGVPLSYADEDPRRAYARLCRP